MPTLDHCDLLGELGRTTCPRLLSATARGTAGIRTHDRRVASRMPYHTTIEPLGDEADLQAVLALPVVDDHLLGGVHELTRRTFPRQIRVLSFYQLELTIMRTCLVHRRRLNARLIHLKRD